jgi:hypothetical protein
MNLTDQITKTLRVRPVDPRLDVFTVGAILVVYCLEIDGDDEVDGHYDGFPFHDETSRIEAYIEARARYEELLAHPRLYSANLSVTLNHTDYF